MSMIYENRGRALSEIAASAKSFLVEIVALNGEPHFRVTMTQATQLNMVLYFNNSWQIVQRDEAVESSRLEKKPHVNIRYFLRDYRPHKDPRGETIWFPQQAVHHYHTGATPEGKLIVNHTETINVKSIRFNVDIPDEKFVLPIPKGLPIYVHRDVPANLVPEGVERYDPEKHKRPPNPNAQPPKKSALLWMTVGGTASLFYLIGCVPVFSWRTPGKSLVVAANQSKALRFLDSATKATLLTFPPFGKTTVLLLLVFLSLPFRSYAADLPSREQVIARLKHQKGLIQSIEAVFEVVHLGTSKEMIPRIKEHYQRIGQAERWERGIFPEKIALTNYTSKWWRKGVREREEKTLHSGNIPEMVGSTTAFDGSLVRRVYDKNDKLGGEIHTVISSDWKSHPRKNPVSMLYENAGRLHSEAIPLAKIFHVDQVSLSGIRHTRITFGDEHFKLGLYFSPDWRLVQQDRIGITLFEKKEAVRCRVLLKDYRPYKDVSGETIWFPSQAIYYYYTGATTEDNPIVNRVETINIKHIRFNVDIQDDKFALQMPKGTPIRIGYDVPASAIPEGIVREDLLPRAVDNGQS